MYASKIRKLSFAAILPVAFFLVLVGAMAMQSFVTYSFTILAVATQAISEGYPLTAPLINLPGVQMIYLVESVDIWVNFYRSSVPTLLFYIAAVYTVFIISFWVLFEKYPHYFERLGLKEEIKEEE